MPKKKSIKKSAQKFLSQAHEIKKFLDSTAKGASAEHVSWLYEHAVIRLCREWESMILHALVGAINNDTATVSKHIGVRLPKHLTDEVCQYLVTGGRYFDFKGRDGLIQTLNKFLPDKHFLVTVIKKNEHKKALDQLVALRNFAAHNTATSKSNAVKTTETKRLRSAGAWLKVRDRFKELASEMIKLANELKSAAPY